MRKVIHRDQTSLAVLGQEKARDRSSKAMVDGLLGVGEAIARSARLKSGSGNPLDARTTRENLASMRSWLSPSTKVATRSGEVLADQLAVGDAIITRHSGILPINHVKRISLRHPPKYSPVHLKAARLVNSEDLLLAPSQPIRVDTEWNGRFRGEKPVWLEAQDFIDGSTVTQLSVTSSTYIEVDLGQPAVIYCSGNCVFLERPPKNNPGSASWF